MFANLKNKERAAWVIVAVVIMVVSLVFGVQYPIPAPPGDEIVALGTTNFDTVVLSQDLTVGDDLTVSDDGDFAGTLNYGANNLYPIGYASSGYQAVYGTSTITGTAVAAHGLTTVTFCMCILGEDPTSGAGDGAMCTVAVSANVCTLKVWQDDFVTAATETDVDVHWLVVGQP